MDTLGNLPLFASVFAMCWLTLAGVVVGHEAADRASRKHVEGLYDKDIAAASTPGERERAEASRAMWRAALPELPKAWP